jgi:polyisoprenoid-binding protein YceI
MSATAIDPRTAVPAHWTVDTDTSTVEFAVRTFWGLATVHGRFDTFHGTYETGPDGAEIELTVDIGSLDTGNRTRDRHLQSDDFFHVAAHPQLHFTSTHVQDVGDRTLHVAGELDAAGRAVYIEFPATVRDVDGVDGGLELEATTTVDQARFGMSAGRLGMIRRPTTLHVRARLVR